MTNIREQDRWISDHVKCLRMENLVYARYEISKGSFYHPMLQHNHWKDIDFNEINWIDDHVFSFMLDPVERYISGLSTDINLNSELTPTLVAQGPELLKRLLIITPHSIPIHNIFFEYAELIDWIPAGVEFDDENMFKKLLDHHALSIDWNTTVTRTTWKKTSLIKEQVRAMLNNDLGIGNRHMWSMLAKDLDLYKKVLHNFDSSAESWPEISWKNK